MRVAPAAALCLILLGGCTSLRSAVPVGDLPAQAAPRTRYQVWSGGTPQVLIALRVTVDSLSGVPYWKPPECDSCRVGLPRSQVDSVRGPGFDPNKTLVLALILTPIVVLVYAYRAMGDPNY